MDRRDERDRQKFLERQSKEYETSLERWRNSIIKQRNGYSVLVYKPKFFLILTLKRSKSVSNSPDLLQPDFHNFQSTEQSPRYLYNIYLHEKSVAGGRRGFDFYTNL